MGSPTISRPPPPPPCNYACYTKKEKEFTDKLEIEQTKTSGHQHEIDKLEYENAIQKSIIDRIITIYFVPKKHKKLTKNDIGVLGRTQYSLLNNKLKERVNILNMQRELIGNQFSVIGNTGMKISKQKIKIGDITGTIDKDTSTLKYNHEIFLAQKTKVLFL